LIKNHSISGSQIFDELKLDIRRVDKFFVNGKEYMKSRTKRYTDHRKEYHADFDQLDFVIGNLGVAESIKDYKADLIKIFLDKNIDLLQYIRRYCIIVKKSISRS